MFFTFFSIAFSSLLLIKVAKLDVSSGMEETFVAINGISQLIASITGYPNPSYKELTIATELDAYNSLMSFFDRLDLNEEEKEIHNKNIDIVGELFKSKNLPECRLNEKNIVIHIRKGDALITGRGDSLMIYEKQIIKIGRASCRERV